MMSRQLNGIARIIEFASVSDQSYHEDATRRFRMHAVA
jgi:hypothetical protein